MELILVRHALPQRRELESGAADPELDDRGHQQAELMAAYLASEHIDGIYVSPMRRARQTSAPLEAKLGLTAEVVDGIAEYDRDSSAYVPVEELKASGDPRWKDMMENNWDGTDSKESFDARVTEAIDKIITENAGNTVAAVCHGGVINQVLSAILGLDDPDSAGFFYPNYTSIHRVAASRSGVRSIVTINETSHLRHTGLPMGLFQSG